MIKISKKMNPYLLAFLLCFISLHAYAKPSIEVPASVSQGRAFVLNYKDSEGTLAKQINTVFVQWQEKTIPLFIESAKNGNGVEGAILLAMPIDTKNNQKVKVVLQDENGQEIAQTSAMIAPVAVKWSQSTLSVDPKFVVPPKEYWPQIEKDKQTINALKNIYSPYNALDLPLVRAVPGTISSGFGTHRRFNNELKSIHTGTDYRGAIGTPIKAVSDGLVVLAEPQYYYGNNVIIDHGQGVYSLYSHLSAFKTEAGKVVKAGEIIGEVGMTGRVTGPHLHLGLIVQGVNVDITPLDKEILEVIGGPTLPQPRQ